MVHGAVAPGHSVTKPMAAFCVLVLVDRGVVGLDDVMARYWPEFARAGKDRVTVHIGIGRDEQLRVVDLVGEMPDHDGRMYRLATSNPPGLLDLAVVNSRAWRAAEIPAVNGHGNADAVARFYAGLVNRGELDEVRLVSPEIVEAMTAGEMTAFDLLLEEAVTWGLGPGVDADGYGMGGLGGSLGLADPKLGLAESYVTRQMGTHERANAMDAAVRATLA
jgi:CubicO group peptidase (beta-lactamase class C family)